MSLHGKYIIDPEELKKRESRYRQAKAIKYVLQGIKYIMGYLPDYPFQVVPQLTENPITLTLKIYWGSDDIIIEGMPTFLKEKLLKMEKELFDVTQRVSNSKILQPVHENRTD